MIPQRRQFFIRIFCTIGAIGAARLLRGNSLAPQITLFRGFRYPPSVPRNLAEKLTASVVDSSRLNALDMEFSARGDLLDLYVQDKIGEYVVVRRFKSQMAMEQWAISAQALTRFDTSLAQTWKFEPFQFSI